MIHDARERDVEAASLVPKEALLPYVLLLLLCCWWWCSPVVSMEDTLILL